MGEPEGLAPTERLAVGDAVGVAEVDGVDEREQDAAFAALPAGQEEGQPQGVHDAALKLALNEPGGQSIQLREVKLA